MVLGDVKSHRRQVEHLAHLLAQDLGAIKVSAAGKATLRHVHDHFVGVLDLLQVAAWVTGLPAGLSARGAPQALGSWLSIAV